MVALETPKGEIGSTAPQFHLESTTGAFVDLSAVMGPKGLVIAFICNHCPYVKAIADRLSTDARTLKSIGIGFVAIMPNDTEAYPEDRFERMKDFAEDHDFDFPYVIDRDQSVAKAYGAVCTPDFFGFNADRMLQYRGRIDDAGLNPVRPDTPRELVAAMQRIAETGQGPAAQAASIGCSIKWRKTA